MASQPNSWWSRPIATHPSSRDRKATCTESIACYSPCYTGIFTVVAVFYLFLRIDQTLSHAKFSIQSINVLPSDLATWHVDFLVKNPSSIYSMYYEDDVSVRLGPSKAIVLNISHRRESRDVTAFSLAFVVEEGNRNEPLYVKLRGKHKRYIHYNVAGHFDVRCPNLTRSHEKKIICQSCFTPLNLVTFRSFE